MVRCHSAFQSVPSSGGSLSKVSLHHADERPARPARAARAARADQADTHNFNGTATKHCIMRQKKVNTHGDIWHVSFADGAVHNEFLCELHLKSHEFRNQAMSVVRIQRLVVTTHICTFVQAISRREIVKGKANHTRNR
jgi:hypothetical protein